jgi:hypothetical protein
MLTMMDEERSRVPELGVRWGSNVATISDRQPITRSTWAPGGSNPEPAD